MKNTRTVTLVSALALSLIVVGSVSAAPGQGGGDKHKGWENREAVHAAVDANDYSQLSTEAQEKISQERFAEMVAKKSSMDAHRSAIESAVSSNDFNAFKAEIESHKADRPEKEDGEDRPEREQPTEEELQTKFNEMVTYYNENGELPTKENGQKMKKKGTVAGAVKRVRKHGLNENQQSRVQTVVNRIEDTEKLETILERIVTKIDAIEAKDIDEARKEKILGILELIQEMIENKLS